jgi:hypothetical protein
MAIKFHKFSYILSACLWSGLGMLTIGGIAVSSIGWFINLGMGLLFLFIGCFMYFHGNSLHRFYAGGADQLQEDPKLQRFLRWDLIFVIISCILSGSLFTAAFYRIFFEGFAVFG